MLSMYECALLVEPSDGSLLLTALLCTPYVQSGRADRSPPHTRTDGQTNKLTARSLIDPIVAQRGALSGKSLTPQLRSSFIVARDMCGIPAGGPVFPWRDGSPLGDRAVNATRSNTEDRALIPDVVSKPISYARATRCRISKSAEKPKDKTKTKMILSKKEEEIKCGALGV